MSLIKLSKTLILVELLLGNIISNFKFSDCQKYQKIGLSSIEKMYHVGALLTNAHTGQVHSH